MVRFLSGVCALTPPLLSFLGPRSSIVLNQRVRSHLVVASGGKVLILAGPTGVGKSELAYRLASCRPAEIINADSVQVYRGMDIGSDKPPRQKMERFPHHLVDILDPKDVYSAADFRRDAIDKIREVHARGNIPIVVGGAGFYLRWLLHEPPQTPKSDLQLKKAIHERLLAEDDWDKNIEKLRKIDPVYAQTLSRNQYVRLARAFEVYESTGKPISSFAAKPSSAPDIFDFRPLFIHRNRLKLFERIDKRCEEMLSRGLFEEVFCLLVNSPKLENPAFKSIGYRATIALLHEYQSSVNPMNISRLRLWIYAFQTESRNYVRRQMVWFRAEKDYHWVDAESADAVDSVFHLYDAERPEFIDFREKQHLEFQKNPVSTGFHLGQKEHKLLKAHVASLRIYGAADKLEQLHRQAGQIAVNLSEYDIVLANIPNIADYLTFSQAR